MLKLIMPEDHDFFGLYQDDKLKFYGSDDYLDPQTVWELSQLKLLTEPLEKFDLSEDGWDALLDGEPYPDDIAPLEPYLTKTKWYGE